jgi:hypothetical protein
MPLAEDALSTGKQFPLIHRKGLLLLLLLSEIAQTMPVNASKVRIPCAP